MCENKCRMFMPIHFCNFLAHVCDPKVSLLTGFLHVNVIYSHLTTDSAAYTQFKVASGYFWDRR